MHEMQPGIAQRSGYRLDIASVWTDALKKDSELKEIADFEQKEMLEKSVNGDVFVRVVCDPWGRGGIDKYDFIDGLVYHHVMGAIERDRMIVVNIAVSDAPFPDKNISGNVRILKESLPENFEGDFWGGNQPGDGYIKTLKDIAWKANENITFHIKAATSFPLEVGYTDSCTVLYHLLNGGSIARWCYGQNFIWLLKTTETYLPPNFETAMQRFPRSLTDA